MQDLTCIVWDLSKLTYVRQLSQHMAPITAIAINDLTVSWPLPSGIPKSKFDVFYCRFWKTENWISPQEDCRSVLTDLSVRTISYSIIIYTSVPEDFRKVRLGRFHFIGHSSVSHPVFKTILYSITNSFTGTFYSVTFMWMLALQDFTHRLKRESNLVQHDKQYHRKVLLSSFHLNRHTFNLRPHTPNLLAAIQGSVVE